MTILGIDIGGTKTAVLLGERDGSTRGRVAFATNPERNFALFLEDLVVHAKQVIAGANTVDCVSIAAGGPMDEKEGLLLGPPHLPGWTDLPLPNLVSEALGLPAMMMHDARASAWAEYRFGAGHASRAANMAHFTFATGFGMGAVLDGRLLDIPGEIGHWRVSFRGPAMFGKTGSLEGLASGAGMAALAHLTGEFDDDVSVRDLADMARGGDHVAMSILRSGAKQVGTQCARIIDQLGVELITLGTIAVQCGDLILETIRESARNEALPHLFERCRIEPAGLGKKLGDVACLSAALYRMEEGSLKDLGVLVKKCESSTAFTTAVAGAAAMVVDALGAGNKVLTCGNGGSATDAAHLAEELIGRFKGDRVSLPSINLAADGSVLTCIANDYGFDEVFSRQVEGLGKEGDVLVAFTTSGNSENINRVLKRARERGLKTIAVTGKSGGEAKTLCDINVHVESTETERIQEMHTFVLHEICRVAEDRFGG